MPVALERSCAQIDRSSKRSPSYCSFRQGIDRLLHTERGGLAKFDIEGAEAAVVRSSVGFLKQNPIRLSFESYHRMRDGGYTWMLLEPLLRSAGYAVESSAEFGQMFTWATPHEVD